MSRSASCDVRALRMVHARLPATLLARTHPDALTIYTRPSCPTHIHDIRVASPHLLPPASEFQTPTSSACAPAKPDCVPGYVSAAQIPPDTGSTGL